MRPSVSNVRASRLEGDWTAFVLTNAGKIVTACHCIGTLRAPARSIIRVRVSVVRAMHVSGDRAECLDRLAVRLACDRDSLGRQPLQIHGATKLHVGRESRQKCCMRLMAH